MSAIAGCNPLHLNRWMAVDKRWVSRHVGQTPLFQGRSQIFFGGGFIYIFLGGLKLQYSCSIAALTSFLPHKKFTWIYPPLLRPCTIYILPSPGSLALGRVGLPVGWLVGWFVNIRGHCRGVCRPSQLI